MIDVRDLRFRWRPDAPLLLDVPRFSVRRGERVFIKGASGSGKTTLLNLLGGVAVAEAGAIVIQGADLCGLSGSRRDAYRADHIGFIFQLFNLIPYLSMIENVLLPCRFSARRRQRALDRGASLEDEARRLLGMMDLDTDDLAGRPVTQLSTGQQQRVAAARAFIGSPDLVIADEPTSALDLEVRRSFLDLLFNEVEDAGATLLFVSHDSSLETAFDRSVALSELNLAAHPR